MKKVFAAFLFVFVSLVVATPRLPVEHTLLGEAAQRDFRIINAIFARSHATAFKQIPAGEAPELFHAKERVPLPVFLSRILKYYGNLHADHTMVGFPPELIEKYGLKNRFFPFPLKFFDKHAYLDTQLSDVPYGAELVDINGKSIHSILQSFAEFPRARATDEPWTSFYLSEQFASWYFLTSKSGAPWRLQFAGLPQETQLVTPNILPQRVSSVRNYWKSILSSMFMDKKKIAYFAINSFFPTNTPYATFEKWVEYFGAFNTEARHRGSTTLILDLRVNRGGVMSLAAASAAWFIENTIVDKSTSRVHTRLLPYREFATAINGQAAKNSDFDQLEAFLYRDFGDTMTDGYFETRNPLARHVKLVPLENVYRFQKIYVLIGPQTYSAAVYFVRLLKLANSNVTLVGGETGSPGDGHSAETLITYRLPESGILFDVPLARVEFAPLVPGQLPGKGLMPDKAIVPTLADFRAGRDTELEAVVDWVEKKSE